MKKTIKTSFLAAGVVVAIAGSASASNTLRNGLTNYWNMDNNLIDQAHLNPLTASTVADNGSFAGVNGTGGIAYTPGLFGQAIEQDGAAGAAQNNGFVNVPFSGDTHYGATTAHTQNTLTSSAWVKVGAFDTGWQAVIAHGEGQQYRISRRGSGFNVSYAGGTGEGADSKPIDITSGWHHVVAISEAGVSTRLWVDNVLTSTGGVPNINDAELDAGGNLLDFNIGANPDTGLNNREWNGNIDEVAQWNRVLTDSEIADLYGGGPTSAKPLSEHIGPVCDIGGPYIGTPGETITFDGSGSSDLDGTIVSYTWDFGDGNSGTGAVVQHTYAFDGFYTVTLVVEDDCGNLDACSIVVEVSTPTDCHDDFNRLDGPLDGWTVVDGFWNIVGNECETISTAIEHAAFLGVPLKALPPASYDICFDWRFLTPGSHPEVGRHAGVMFEFNQARNRKDPTTGGYQVDWIDRASDRGLRLTRWEDSGAKVNLVEGQGIAAPLDPPASIRIEVRGDNIKVFGDGVLYIDFDDGTYRRQGRVGLWTYQSDQHVAFDDFKVLVGPPLDPICDIGGPPQLEFADDFNRNASQVVGWTVDAGDWSIDNGRLQIGPTNAEQDIFAGDPPLILASAYIIEFDMEFLGPGSDLSIGRHAGVNFSFNQAGNRYSAETNGYQVYWIDRAADRGLSLHRFDGVVNVPLAVGQADNLIDPPLNIRVEVDECNIRVYGDDILYIDVMDATYRGGISGFWTDERGQEVAFDNFAIDPPSEAGSYEAWAQQFIPAGKDRSFGGDGDDDGDPNGYEFGVDAQGGVSDSESNRKAILKPSPNSSTVDIEFGFRPGKSDLIWIVERSHDLVQLEEIYRLADGVQTLSTNILARLDPADSSRLIVTDSNPFLPRCFYQLRIERKSTPPPPPPVAVFSEDFESGQGGWTTGSDGGPGTDWELGTPTVVGPLTANSPANCFGTNLSANYGGDANVWLRSPAIDLILADCATLNYWEFKDIEAGFDSGTVSVLDAHDDSLLAVIETVIDGVTPDWERVSKAIPAEGLGKIIKIEFRFQSDDISNFAGWYIDDVEVTVR